VTVWGREASAKKSDAREVVTPADTHRRIDGGVPPPARGMTRAAPLTPEALLAPLPPATRKLADRIRAVVLRAVPTLTERALPGWRAIAFRDEQAGHVCALFPFGDEVRLYIEHGARLDDPDGLLQGAMKRGRYVPFRTERDVRARALARLIRRAVLLQSL
jgi:hypothetical protein